MVKQKNFGIIGGDFRQIYLAEKFISEKCDTFLWGFDKLKDSKFLPQPKSLSELVEKSNYIVLPLPVTRDGINLNAPFCSEKIPLNEDFWSLMQNKVIFTGMISSLKLPKKIFAYDYAEKEEFKILNAIPTAEGAIQLALEKNEKTLFGSRCLVAGFGRIGKVISNRLKNFGAKITVNARKSEDIAWIKTLGYEFIDLREDVKNLDYDFIFNTIPEIIFNSKMLSRCKKNTVIIDVASSPGGVDTTAANLMGIESVHALGIPGKMFPRSAAGIIYSVIKNIIKEKNL